MELQQTFTVPVPVDRAWDALLDPQRIAPCMPGASLESVEGDAFTGNVKIKLGPINLSYRGQARYVTKNADTRTIVIEGTGKDAKEAARPAPPSPRCSPATATARPLSPPPTWTSPAGRRSSAGA